MNFVIVYLGSYPNQQNNLKDIFNITSYNIIKILDSPFSYCYNKNICGLINCLHNNFKDFLPKTINVINKNKLIKMFIVNEISTKFLIYHHFSFFNFMCDEKRYYNFKKMIVSFLNYIDNNKDKNLQFIFIRYCCDKNYELKFYDDVKKMIMNRFDLKHIILIFV